MRAADKAWIRMDRPYSRMVITAVIVTSGRVSHGRIAALMLERLSEYPRFVGSDPASFDVRAHVVSAELPVPADAPALQRFVGEVMAQPLPRERPLWRLHVVERYGPDRSALVWRIHHAIADGTALMRVLLSIADVPPDAEVRPPARREREMLGGVRLLARGAVALGRLVLLPSDPPSRLKGALSGEKRVAWSAAVPLDAVKAFARKQGATVNDVLVTALSGAIGRYLAAHGEAPPRSLRAILPLDLRTRPADACLGNRFGLLFLSLPIAERDPMERLHTVQRRMARLKRSPEAVVAFRLVEWVGRLSSSISALGLRFFARKATVVLTNVAGPGSALCLGGARIEEIEFWIPHPGGLAVGFSIMSYAGSVRVGVAADAARVPDPERLARAFEEDVSALLG